MTEEVKKKSSNKIVKSHARMIYDSEDDSSFDDEEYLSHSRSKSRGKELKDDDFRQPEDSSRRRRRRGRRGRSGRRRRSRSRRRH